jgi:hypothetical protein
MIQVKFVNHYYYYLAILHSFIRYPLLTQVIVNGEGVTCI